MDKLEKALNRRGRLDAPDLGELPTLTEPVPDNAQLQRRDDEVIDRQAPQLPLSADTDPVIGDALPLKPSALASARICALANDAASSAFKMIRTQLLQRLEQQGWRSLAVVSAVPGDGKSVVAVNLALAIAQDPRRRALLIDLNLREPQLHHMLGVPVSQGLESYFSGRCELESVPMTVYSENLTLMPCLTSVPDSTMQLATARGARLKTLVREQPADTVTLVDLPPLLTCDDALALLPAIDAVLVIVGEGISRKQDLTELRALLGGKPIAGVLLNQSRSTNFS